MVREAVTLAGRGERARVARAFIDGVLGPGHPRGDVAALLVDELFVNSIRHSGSRVPGETTGLPCIELSLRVFPARLLVEVTDSSPRPPCL
jgi:anti-sigma regulatory factor (Ser/Thr protein kinase)